MNKLSYVLLLLVILSSCARDSESSESPGMKLYTQDKLYSPIYTTEEMDDRIACWYNYSTIDWTLLDTIYYRPYSGDWPKVYEAHADSSHFDCEGDIASLDCKFWYMLQNARTKFHKDNLLLRSYASDETKQALDQTEAAFDSVFVRYMNDCYYSRAMVDAYQEVMPQAIDNLIEAIRKQNLSKQD